MKDSYKKMALAFYMIAWFCVIVYLWINWHEFNWLQKTCLVLGEIFFAPDLKSAYPIFFRKARKHEDDKKSE